MRTGRHEYFMRIAEAVATRGTCPKQEVGAILVNPTTQLFSTGYNGAARGMPHCIDVKCIIDDYGKCRRVVHAEANAILGKSWESLSNLYTTHFPCLDCCMLIVNARIITVYFRNEYQDPRAIGSVGLDPAEYLHEGGVGVYKVV